MLLKKHVLGYQRYVSAVNRKITSYVTTFDLITTALVSVPFSYLLLKFDQEMDNAEHEVLI